MYDATELHQSSSRRRHEFPSWSWAGWIGPVHLADFPEQDVFASHLITGIDQIHLEDTKGNCRSLESIATSDMSEHYRYPILVIKTVVVPPRALQMTYRKKHILHYIVCDYMAWELYLTEKSASIGKVVGQLKNNPDQWRCVLLGPFHNEYVSIIHSLILRREPGADTWTRIGTMGWKRIRTNKEWRTIGSSPSDAQIERESAGWPVETYRIEYRIVELEGKRGFLWLYRY